MNEKDVVIIKSFKNTVKGINYSSGSQLFFFCFTIPFEYFLTYRDPLHDICSIYIKKKHKMYNVVYICSQ